MQLIPSQNIASSKITVTATATLLYSLINTAGNVTNTQVYAGDPSINGVGTANGVIITPEDGDIRLGYDITPTASLGMLLSSGTKYFLPSIDLSTVKLIRTSGDVACSIDLVACSDSDFYSATAEKVELEGTITVGDINVTELGGNAITTGAGAVAAGTQRITLASDDPGVALLGTIDTDTGNIATDTSTIAGDTTSIDTKTPALGTAIMTGAVPVTIATDDTMITALDAAVDTIAGAISGTEMQVDVVAALPAGTNTIGAVLAATATPESGTDATGADTYATVLTPSTTFRHISIANEGANPATVSIDGGVTDTFARIPGGSIQTFDGVAITATAIQAKNASAGNNYANLTITVW